MDEDRPRADQNDVIDLTDRLCPEGHRLEEAVPFCPVCLAPVMSSRALWSVNQGVAKP